MAERTVVLTRQASCQTKRRYPDAKAAHKKVKKLNRRDETAGMLAYPCTFCGGWHITSAMRRRSRD